MFKVIDISKYQKNLNGPIAKDHGIKMVMLRACYSIWKDARFDSYVDVCNKNCIRKGTYCFVTFHYSSNNQNNVVSARACMQKEINAYLSIIKNHNINSWVAVDQELEAGRNFGLSRHDNTMLLNEACHLIAKAGYTPCLYCSASWAMNQVDMTQFKYPLWCAYYYNHPYDPDFDNCIQYKNMNDRYSTFLKTLGDRVVGWQFGSINFGSKYGVDSRDVDRNWFYSQPEGECEMTFDPVKNKVLVVTKDENPHCQAFSTPDIYDEHYTNIKKGEYEIESIGPKETVNSMEANWVKLKYREPMYVLALPDRCEIKDVTPDPDPTSKITVTGDGKLADFIRSLAAYLETFEKEE